MTVINKLASYLGRRDEVPNQELAKNIAETNNAEAVKELIENLEHKNKAIQGDCIKVLYEIGERKPELIAEYAKDFVGMITHKVNRIQWGAMTALDAIAGVNPKVIFEALPEIIQAGYYGTVITKDHVMNILIKLCASEQYGAAAFEFLIKELKTSLINQVAMYAEKAMPIINANNKALFIETLTSRLVELPDSKKKRIEKVIKKVS